MTVTVFWSREIEVTDVDGGATASLSADSHPAKLQPKPKEPANGNGGGKADEAKTSEAKPSAAPPAPAKK